MEGQKFLIEKTCCEIFLATPETLPKFEVIRSEIPQLKVFQAPTTQELLDPSLGVSYYEGRQNRDMAAHSLILHTSGSTGAQD